MRVNYIGEKRRGMLTFQEEEESISGERREAVAAVGAGAKAWRG